MGSFYANCSITNKTISDGDEMVIQFMVPSWMADYDSQLSYEDWVKFQRGELKIGNANNLSFFDKLIGAFKKQNKLNYEK